MYWFAFFLFFFSSRRRHTGWPRDWSSDVCSSDLQGVTAIHMSYLPELFGSRYRYSGVTLGREISAVIGGGIAPLVGSALLSWFMESWIPVAIYMALTMLVSFIATFTAPETINRDLMISTDAKEGEQRPGVFVRS